MSKRIIYPLYQLGNPQLRIFRPTFNLALVRPGKEQPPDTVQFRIPMEMTKFDVRNYLEKIYSVPVAAVRTRIQYCEHITVFKFQLHQVSCLFSILCHNCCILKMA
uniref:Large ribosomal subunit protein uL23m n=1 Tax=Cyprinus carpio TaxID=7962 RepID=A0A8C1V6J0_CYPCA